MQAVLFKIPGQEWHWLGGMTLLERNLRLLSQVGVEKALVLHPPGDRMPLFTVPRALDMEVIRSPLEIGTANPLTILPALHQELDKPFLLFDANLLVDQRVLATLSEQPPPAFIVLGNGVFPPPWRVGMLAPRHLSMGNDVFHKAQRLSLLAVAERHRESSDATPPYCEKMGSEEDLQRGWRLLLDRVSTQPADVLEKYVYPALENRIVTALCTTAVTPGQVLLLSFALALFAASLFYHGWFVLAVFFAFAALLLDGVEGKLARIKLMAAPLSQAALAVRLFTDTAWWLALAARLARTVHPAALEVGVALAACALVDRMLGVGFANVVGKPLEAMSDWDRRLNFWSGRSSLYLVVLLIGAVLGVPLVALQAVLTWALLTLAMRCGRSAWLLWRWRAK